MLSSISGSSSAAQVVDQIFKKVDSNRDNKITKDELTQALKSDTAVAGASEAPANADQIFKQLDTGNKGYLTRQDAAAGLNQLPQTLTGGATAPAGGGVPKGAGGAGGGGGAVTITNPDPADANQDGKVSIQEQLDYAQKQYSKTESAQPQSVTYA